MEWLIVGLIVFVAGATLAARTLRNLKGYAAIAGGAGPGEGASACGSCTACDVGMSGGAPRDDHGLLACGATTAPASDGAQPPASPASHEPAVGPRLRVAHAAPQGGDTSSPPPQTPRPRATETSAPQGVEGRLDPRGDLEVHGAARHRLTRLDA